MNGYLLLAIELAAILVVCVGLALFLGWVLGKRSARAKLLATQESESTRQAPDVRTTAASGTDEKKEPTPLSLHTVPVTTQAAPVAAQSSSPIVMASTPDSQQPVSNPSPFAPNPSAAGATASAETGTPQPDLLNDRTVSDDSTVDTHMIPRIADQATPSAPESEAPDPRLLEAETRATEAEAKAQEAEARIEEAEAKVEEANQRARDAEAKAQEAETKVEEAGQQVTQADQRVSEAEARAAEAETRAQEADQHISAAEQARRQVVELEERINKQEIDMARLENRATAAWDKTMPTLIERIESLEDDLSQARREAAELQAMLTAEREQIAPTPAPEDNDTEPEPAPQAQIEETGETGVIKEEPWQTIGPGAGAAQETPIAFASSTLPDMQPTTEEAETEPEQEDDTPQAETAGETEPEPVEDTTETSDGVTEEPEPAGVTEEDATAEATDVEPADEGTDETEAIEEQPPAEEPAEEQEVHPHEQLAPTAVVEHEVEVPDHEKHEEQDEKAEEPSEDEKPGEPDNEDEEPAEDEENTETRLMPLIPEPTFTDFEEFTAAWKAREVPKPEKKPESTTAWPEPDDAEAATATRLIPVIKDEEPIPRPSGGSDDLSALTDTGSFARLIATGPAPEVPSFAAPLDIPETEYLAPTTPAYPVTTHHDDATIPDIPRITAPITQPFEAPAPATNDLLIDETEVDEVPVTAGLSDPEPAAEPHVNAGHIITPQFSMTKEHNGVLRSPLEPKGQQLSISLEEDYTLADPVDEAIEVMDAPEEEFPVGVGIPPEDYPRAR